MKALVKSGVVLAGYVAAVLLASAALAVRLRNTQGPDTEASAGMYAFGDAMLFLAVFGFAAIVPTGLAFYFLRPYRWFWTALSITALAIAATGFLAASIYILAAWCQPRSEQSFLMVWSALAVLRMLASPVLATGFAVFALIAPNRTSRWALAIAAGIDGAVAAYSVFHWSISCHFT